MKGKVIALAVLVLFCVSLNEVFAEKTKVKISQGKALHNGYFYPLYIGAKDVYSNTDYGIEYTIKTSSDKRALDTVEKIKKYYSSSFVVKHMGGNRISLKAQFNRAPTEMKDVFIASTGDKEPAKGSMVAISREGKIIKVYIFITNDSALIQPIL